MKTKKLKKAVRKIRRLLVEARKKDLNEADTRNLVEKFLESVLGYNIFKEITAEEAVESKFADYAIKINNRIAMFIEIKSIQTKLKDSHVFQVKNYAASKGVPWCVLTNGIEYRLYHIDFSEAVKHEVVFETNVVDDDPNEVAEKVYYLSRKSLAKNEAEKVWRRQKSLSEQGLLEAILSPRVLRAIRKQVQVQSRQRISEVDMARGLKRMFSEQLYDAYEKLAEKLQRKKRRHRKVSHETAVPAPAATKPVVKPAPAPAAPAS